MQRVKIIIIIIVYLFTSSDKTIHRDLELLTSTSYTAVGSGFGPQGVPAEKPRNLLTHPPSQRVWVCWDCCCSVRIYIWDLEWCTRPLHLHILIMAKLFLKRKYLTSSHMLDHFLLSVVVTRYFPHSLGAKGVN